MPRKLVVLALGALLLLAAAAPAQAASSLEIKVLSNRADLISGGDALVEVKIPAGVATSSVKVFDDSRDVTSSFARRLNGRYEGLVTGLSVGPNVLTARAPGFADATITVTDHPNGGPVFSGPQVKPWVCQSSATDSQCNQPPTYTYQYKSSVTGQFSSYDPQNPPTDVARIQTDNGQMTPYIVRVETGYQDRDQYQIAVIYNPSTVWQPWVPQLQWNHKLLITHGASCGIEHQSGSAPDVMNDPALSRGYAVMSTALDNAGHNCNIVTQAESLVMAKERLVEQYGELRFTIGTGCSGGSLTQQQVANAYPGIYQGILPQCSFPDSWSTGQQLVDYHFVRGYVEDPSKWGTGVAWTPESIAAVEGHPNHVNSIVFDTVYWTDLGVPDDGCAGVPASDDYNAQTNPGGVRCTLADYMINVFGPRPSSVWIDAEKQVGHGFAGLPLDNVGVQYGLEALKKGLITTAQFVDLNAKIGGADIDINPTTARTPATEPALLNAYRSGGINTTNNLDRVAIIDLRGPDPGAFHDVYRSWAIRARLEREHGTFANQVIWFGETPLLGDPNYATEGFIAMDRWLTAVEGDFGTGTLAEKIRRDRPSDVNDRCTNIDGVDQVDVPGVGKVCELPDVQTKYGTPHTVAGEGVATDSNKCTLKPLRRLDYYPIAFTDAQWQQLQAAFPTGVCDWSKPGIDQRGANPWQTYQDGSGNVVYGGQSLGPAPAGSGGGWTSSAFGSWLG
jgi:Tannase-like family of unknown function (DUF6351)